MRDQWPEPDVIDGDFTAAQPIGLPVFSSPIKATTAEYIFTQDWLMARKQFRATPLGTPHPSGGQFPDYSNFVLVSEGPRQDVGGGMVKWQRTYAIVPASHDEYESFSYPLIGLSGSWEIGNQGFSVTATGRPRRAQVVSSRVRHDYFMTTSPGAIPTMRGQRYFAGNLTALVGPQTGIDTDFLIDVVGAFPASSPSRTQYTGWMVNALASQFTGGAVTSWSGVWSSTVAYHVGDTVSDAGSIYQCLATVGPTGTHPAAGAQWALLSNITQFTAEDSRLSRWEGNIWLRQSRFILAQ